MCVTKHQTEIFQMLNIPVGKTSLNNSLSSLNLQQNMTKIKHE